MDSPWGLVNGRAIVCCSVIYGKTKTAFVFSSSIAKQLVILRAV
jgi:hypothetical protein